MPTKWQENAQITIDTGIMLWTIWLTAESSILKIIFYE
jgi:hypothetical protein